MRLHTNCIYVSGDNASLRAFFALAEAPGGFTLAPWMDDVPEDEEHPDGFCEPCVEHGSDENGGEWTDSWDSDGPYFVSVLRTAEAWPALRFDYYVCCLEGEPWFSRATYEGGHCTDSDDTEDGATAREWHRWFEDLATDWDERTEGES